MSRVGRREAEAPLALALDLGTSSVRAAVFDANGRAVEGLAAWERCEIRTSKDGAAECDADELLERVFRCLDAVLGAAGSAAGRIAGVGASSLAGSILAVDAAGQPLTPLITYADTRSAADAKRLRARLDETEVHERTGCRFHPSYLPAQFSWLGRARPEVFQRAARWLPLGSYLEWKLFGEAATSYSLAAWSGLLDRRALAWDGPLLAALGMSAERLPELTDANVPRRGLKPPWAKRWPALEDAPWFPAIGDGAAANLGSGCVTPARIALTVGTTSAVRAVVPAEIAGLPSGLWCYCVDRLRRLPGGALSEGGNVYAWVGSLFRLPPAAELEAALARMEPDAHGLTVLPFVAGERAPGWAGDARAAIEGLSLATRPEDVARAALEAVAYRIAIVYDLLRPVLEAATTPGSARRPGVGRGRTQRRQIVTSGGAMLSSPAWQQIMADVLGEPIAASQVEQASARGAALLALESLGVLEDLEQAPAFLGPALEPDPKNHSRYREALARQERLYERLVARPI